MAIYNLDNYKAADGLGFPLNFRRGNPNPLDNSSVWASLEAAQNYAATDATAYVGQILSVVNATAGTVTIYSIQDTTGKLEMVGTGAMPDGVSIEKNDDGKLTVVGFAAAETGAQPRKTADGKIEWVVPSTETVEGLQSAVAGLQSDVTGMQSDVIALKTTVGDANDGLVKAVADNKSDISDINTKIGNVAEGKTVVEMISDAKVEVTEAIMGDAGIDEKYDTLREVADWILADTTNSAELITRLSNIEADYLKTADKTEIEEIITTLDDYVGNIPEGATSTNVVAYINEVITALKIGDYAKATDLADAVTRIGTLETDVETLKGTVETLGTDVENLKALDAEKNIIASVDTEQFTIDDDRHLTLNDIAIEKVTGLAEALEGKVDAVEGSRLITEDEGDKISKIELDEEGNATFNGEIDLANVIGLTEALGDKVSKEEGKGLSTNDFTNTLLEKLNGIADGANVNIIETISIGDETLEVTDKNVALPTATDTKLGMVKGSTGINKVSIAEDGTMYISSISMDMLSQTEGETLILNGGSAS